MFDPEKGPTSWTGYVRAAPAKWNDTDGETILQAVLDAKKHPVSRPFDPKKLARRPFVLKSKVGAVTVPASEAQDEVGQPAARVSRPYQSKMLNVVIKSVIESTLGSAPGSARVSAQCRQFLLPDMVRTTEIYVVACRNAGNHLTLPGQSPLAVWSG
jgi:hypothetical protein